MDAAMVYLPEEIIYQFLLRLPSKSLVRFRCVSKWFCAIIDSRSFINSHLHTSRHRKLIGARPQLAQPNSPSRKIVFKLDALDFNYQQQQLEQESMCVENLYFRKPMYCECNGLVVFYLASHKLCVWNPSTRKHWKIPACPYCLTSDYDTTLKLGLGYDSITDDYKAVLILASSTIEDLQVWIIGLRRGPGRRWRKVKDDFPYKDYIYFASSSKDGCFADGAIHFLCRNMEQEPMIMTMVAFDVVNETFSILTKTQLPELPGPHHRILFFETFEGCLSLKYIDRKDSPSGEDQSDVHLYVRSNSNNNNNSWTELYHVEGHEPDEVFRNCLSNGRFLGYSNQEPGNNKVFLFYRGKIYSYHLNEKTLGKEIQTSHKNIGDCFFCVESLVSLD